MKFGKYSVSLLLPGKKVLNYLQIHHRNREREVGPNLRACLTNDTQKVRVDSSPTLLCVSRWT